MEMVLYREDYNFRQMINSRKRIRSFSLLKQKQPDRNDSQKKKKTNKQTNKELLQNNMKL